MAGTIDRGVWYSRAYDSSGSIRCTAPEALSFMGPPISGSRTHINAYTVPIREQPASTIAPALAAWEPSPPRGDSLGVMNTGDPQVKYLSAGPASRNLEPAITTGRFSSTPAGLRIWITWRSNATGNWKLYGASRLIIFNGIESREQPPASAALLQNFPNPFNPRTVIRFSIQNTTWVQLVVYDLLGREVSTLVNGRMPAGVHSVQFDGSGLASGVYVYRLQAGGFTGARSMLLAR
jgi:hypothetical protein